MASAEEYANWLVNNQDKAGTEDFKTVQKAYLQVRPSTVSEKVEATGRGFNVGVADVIGAPVDLVNQAPRLLNLLPGVDGFTRFSGEKNPILGSQSIRNTMGLLDLGYSDIEDLPQSQRPYAVGGEVFGQTLGTAIPAFGAASRIPAASAAAITAPKSNVASQTVDDILKSIARRPATSAAVETGAAIFPSTGAGVAEQIDPGDTTSRLYGELAGAFSPIIVANTLPPLIAKIKQAISTRLPGGTEREAAVLLQKSVIDEGGSPKEIAKTLKGDVGSQTSGQASGDPALLAIENRLISEGSEIGKRLNQDVGQQTTDAIKEFNDVYKAAIQTGDPELLRLAAQARQQHVTTSLDARVANAEERAKSILSTDVPTKKIAASKKAREILNAELKTARTTENQLWSEVNRDLTVDATQFLKKFKEISSELTVGEKLPAPVSALANSLKKARKGKKLAKGQTTSGDLLRARSRYLTLAREARANSQFGDARTYQVLADSMLDDLDPIVGNAASTARSFSRKLNEKFTQGFVGDTLGFKRDGSQAVAVDRTLEVAQAGSDTQQRLNIEALQRAAGDQAPLMAEQQKDFFFQLASDTTNFDGSINSASLERFISNNPQTLRSLGLEADLTDVASRRRLADRFQELAKKGSNFARQKSTAARVLNVNDVNSTISSALRSKNISSELGDLVRLAKKSSDPAVLDGLRYGVFENLLDLSTTSGNLISGNRLEALLNVQTGGKSLKQTLVSQGVLTTGQVKNIEKLIAKGKQFEAALASTAKSDDLLGGEDIFFDLLLRIGGANLGAQSALAGAAGTPLVLAGVGVRAAQKVFDKVPRLKVKGVIAEAIKDPKLMATLLEKPTTVSAKAARDRRLNAVLLQAGFFEGSEFFEEDRP